MKTQRFPLLLALFILGSLVLSACTGAGVISTFPGVSTAQSKIYLADQGFVYALDASTGAKLWSFPDKAATSTPFYAPPAVSQDLIVVGNYGHMLYGLDLNGKQKWVFDGKNGHFVGGPAILGDLVLAPSSDNILFAVNAADGSQRWVFKSQNGLWGTPVSDGQVVYVPALDHNLYALKLADGSLVWKKDLGSALLSSPILTKDGTLYLSTMEGEVVSLKAANGAVQWRTPTEGRIWSTPLQNKDVLYVGNSNNKVLAISSVDGKVQWQKDAGAPVLAGGALVTDGVAFPTETGTLIAWSLDGQKELWRQTINGKLYTTPAVTGQTMVVAVTQGDKLLQSFNLNGQPTWPFVAPK